DEKDCGAGRGLLRSAGPALHDVAAGSDGQPARGRVYSVPADSRNGAGRNPVGRAVCSQELDGRQGRICLVAARTWTGRGDGRARHGENGSQAGSAICLAGGETGGWIDGGLLTRPGERAANTSLKRKRRRHYPSLALQACATKTRHVSGAPSVRA